MTKHPIKTALLSFGLLSLAAPAFTQSLDMPTLPKTPQVHTWSEFPFSLQYADGRTLTSQELEGKMVFIDAWATWCAPCMPSLPKFETLYRKSLSNPHVKVLSVHLSDRYGRFDNAAKFLAAKDLYYPVLQDPEGELVNNIDTVRPSFAVPHYVLMDGTGKIIRRYGEINDMVILDVENHFSKHAKTARLSLQ